MRLFKFTLFYFIYFISLVSNSFASEIFPIHIALLEDPTFIKTAPFASRVQVFAFSDSEEEEELKKHGAAVCSVLVGQHSPLPQDTTVTVVPNLKQFSSYISSLNSNDLVILNWSGSTGQPEMPEEHLEELQEIVEHFNIILGMNMSEFATEVDEYINAYEGFLEQLPQDDNALSILLNYAKTCLQEIVEEPTRLAKNKDLYTAGLLEKIENFKTVANAKAMIKFEEMKKDLLNCLNQHNNTLIVWALGNEGKDIDSDPFWIELLRDESILSHTILICGLQHSGKRAVDSNFTTTYADHIFGKQFRTKVWAPQKSCYCVDEGTSFSAPLATIDAFLIAQQKQLQTCKTPFYADVKHDLLKK